MWKKPPGICGSHVFFAVPQAPGKASTENSDCLLQQVAMPIRKKNAGRARANGFTLLEVAIVLAISMVVTGMAFLTITWLLPAQRVINAYNTTMAVMRQARDNAVTQRTSYSVTFSNSAVPNTIIVAPVLPAGGTAFTGEQSTVTYQLPADVSFLAQTGLPNATATAPDSYYNSGLQAIDLGYAANGYTSGVKTVYFCPDGSAQNAQNGAGQCSGSWEGGVVYIAQSGNLLSSRAITLWGATGHIRGWRLYPKSGGGYQWTRQ
ncbi:MAG: prepilin-type N-terminal cleavage/methylation domain-containing protein [Terriglobales bacterium]